MAANNLAHQHKADSPLPRTSAPPTSLGIEDIEVQGFSAIPVTLTPPFPGAACSPHSFAWWGKSSFHFSTL